MKCIVYSDLDGTLLNHDSYSFDEAFEALSYLKTNAIPLVIVTSKTFSEVQPLQKKLNIECPFIVENGAGIFISSHSPLAEHVHSDEEYIKVSQARSYLELRIFFKHLQQKYAIHGFGDMQIDEVMELTSLEKEDALNAMKRDFTEPFILKENVDIQALVQEAHEEGLDILKGGRFYHLISKGQDKAKAMLYLTHLYQEYYHNPFTMIALGDSPNDFTMLRAADTGVLIPRYDGTFADMQASSILKASSPGSKGWNSAILEIFNAK